MTDISLRSQIDRLIEDLIRDPVGDGATLASILIAVQIALRANELPGLENATWEFIDSRRLPRATSCTSD